MKKFSFRKSFSASILAGTIFFVLELIMVWIFLGKSPWGPSRLMASIVLGKAVLPPPDTFDLGIFIMALIVNFILAFIYSLIIDAIVHRASAGFALLLGFLGGLALYYINFYVFTFWFPWFASARNWVTVLTHIIFGISAALIYKGFIRLSSNSSMEVQPEQY